MGHRLTSGEKTLRTSGGSFATPGIMDLDPRVRIVVAVVFAVVVVAMGLLQRDGILVLIGAALGTAWIAALIFAGATLVSLIKGWLGL